VSAPDETEVPILLLSGLAADERLFAPQHAAFPNLRVIPWAEPLRGESLRGYAARLAPRVDPGRPCVVGGASFGGMVALELARHLPARACVLIGSVRSPAAFPLRWRVLEPLAHLGPDVLRVLAGWSARLPLSAVSVRRLRRIARPESAFERWGFCAAVRWRPGPPTVPVFHIHGSADAVLLPSRVRPDVLVPEGRHALSLSHPRAVNEFLEGVLREVS
jgi:pimeloyl-ACP methyl ester carboxylesterase